MTRSVTLLAVVGTALGMPSGAVAASTPAGGNSSNSTYQAPGSQLPGVSATGTPTGVANAAQGTGTTATGSTATLRSAGSLPFTGIDAILLAGGGITLMGAGVAVRATVSRKRH